MRLGINAYRLCGQRNGIGRYIEYMVQYWDKMLNATDRMTVYLREPLGDYKYSVSSKTTFEVLSPPLKASLWENILLPTQSRNIDVLFCPNGTVPLIYPGKRVVAIHNVNEVQSGTNPWWYPYTWGMRYHLSARGANAVIANSESVKREIQQYYGIVEDKIVVAPLGTDDCFRPIDDVECLRQVRISYFGDDRPFILWVGTMSKRRNIPSLIQAFALLKKSENIPHGLLLLGGNPQNIPIDEMARDLGIAGSVVQSDGVFIDHSEIVPIYNAAALFVSPSLYEGFSLTLCEAMACGVPVVATNGGAIAEIVGDAGVLIDEPTTDNLACAMSRILSDAHLSAELRRNSLQRSRLFTYENTAAITLNALRQVADS